MSGNSSFSRCAPGYASLRPTRPLASSSSLGQLDSAKLQRSSSSRPVDISPRVRHASTTGVTPSSASPDVTHPAVMVPAPSERVKAWAKPPIQLAPASPLPDTSHGTASTSSTDTSPASSKQTSPAKSATANTSGWERTVYLQESCVWVTYVCHSISSSHCIVSSYVISLKHLWFIVILLFVTVLTPYLLLCFFLVLCACILYIEACISTALLGLSSDWLNIMLLIK